MVIISHATHLLMNVKDIVEAKANVGDASTIAKKVANGLHYQNATAWKLGQN